METIISGWAEFSVERLAALCRLRDYCDCFADSMTKRFLQRAIFSVYLDCCQAGFGWRAREVLAQWVPEPVSLRCPQRVA